MWICPRCGPCAEKRGTGANRGPIASSGELIHPHFVATPSRSGAKPLDLSEQKENIASVAGTIRDSKFSTSRPQPVNAVLSTNRDPVQCSPFCSLRCSLPSRWRAPSPSPTLPCVAGMLSGCCAGSSARPGRCGGLRSVSIGSPKFCLCPRCARWRSVPVAGYLGRLRSRHRDALPPDKRIARQRPRHRRQINDTDRR
jgi:hypothetical protein